MMQPTDQSTKRQPLGLQNRNPKVDSDSMSPRDPRDPTMSIESLNSPTESLNSPIESLDSPRSPSESLEDPSNIDPSVTPTDILYISNGQLRDFNEVKDEEVERLRNTGFDESVLANNPFFTPEGNVKSDEGDNPYDQYFFGTEAGRQFLVDEKIVNGKLVGSELSFRERLSLAEEQTHLYDAFKMARARYQFNGEDSSPITAKDIEDRLNNYGFIDTDQMEYMVNNSDSLEQLDFTIDQYKESMEKQLQFMGDDAYDFTTGLGYGLLASSYDLGLIGLGFATGGLGVMARSTATVAKMSRIYRNNRLYKALPQVAKGRYAKITGVAVGSSAIEGYADRKLRGELSSTQDFALDMLMGLGVGTVWSGAIAGSTALKDLFNQKSVEASKVALASDLRDRGVNYGDIEDKGVKEELKDLQIDGKWMSTTEMDQFYTNKAVDKEVSLLEKFNLFSQVANDKRSPVSNFGKFMMHGGIQGKKVDGVKEKQSITFLETYQRRLDASTVALNRAKLQYLGQWQEDLGYKNKPINFFRSNFQSKAKSDEFHRLVTLATTGTKSEFKAVNNMAEYLFKDNKAIADRLVEAGVVRKDQLLQGNYFPRVWDMVKVKEKFQEDGGLGKQRFINLLMTRIKPIGDGNSLSIEDKQLIASIFAESLEGRSKGLDISNEVNIGQFLNDPKSPEYEAFVEEFYKRRGKKTKEDRKEQGHLNFRMDLEDVGGLIDYLDTNFESVKVRYNMQMEAMINAKEHGLNSVKLEQLRDYALDALDMTKYWDRQKAAAINYVSNISMGRPAYDDIGEIGQSIRFLRDIAFFRLGNNMGIAQIPDLFVRASEQGFRALFRQLPLFSKYLKALPNHEFISPKLMGEMQIEFGGIGLSRYSNAGHYDADFGDGFSRLRHIMENLNQGVNMGSFLNLMNDINQNGALEQLLLDWNSIAKGNSPKGKKVLGKWTNNRLAEAGIDAEDVKRIGEQIKKHSNKDSYNLKQWDDPRDAELFLNASSRLLNKAAQRLSTGERIPMLMGNGAGDVMLGAIMQFKSFLFGATFTQFLRNAQHRDRMAAFALMYGFLGGLASFHVYIGQRKLTMSDREFKKWVTEEDPFSIEGYITGAISRASILGIVPTTYDFTTSLFGVDPVFSNRYTVPGNAFSIDNLPAFQIAGRLGKRFNNFRKAAIGETPLYHEDVKGVFSDINNHAGLSFGVDSFLKLFDLPSKY